MQSLISRISGKYRRTVSSRFFRRPLKIKSSVPIISFTFDDAPQSAFEAGAEILSKNFARGTFFISLGLLSSDSPSGRIATQDDLMHAITNGQELGCHTYDHQDPWSTPKEGFIKSVLKNQEALANMMPNIAFTAFAYPIRAPRPSIKRRMGELFICCRGGGQTFNTGAADLNLLKSYFLDYRNRDNIDVIKKKIDDNASKSGWMIFSTHDVSVKPSKYGCTINFFDAVVCYAVKSGSVILPITEACLKLQADSERTAVLPSNKV